MFSFLYSYSFYEKALSGLLITTIFLSQVVVIDPLVRAYDAVKEQVNLVVLLTAEELLKDTQVENAQVSRADQDKFTANISSLLSDASLDADVRSVLGTSLATTTEKTMPGRILRYAADVEQELQNTKVLIVPIKTMDSPELPWKVQEVLTKMYTEGIEQDGAIARLTGIVMIGDVPLPLVTKQGRNFLSVYPYTDFEDPAYYYDHQRGQFLFNEQSGVAKPEVWHGVIRYPVSWQQYLLDGTRAQSLSDSKKDTTGKQYNDKVEIYRQEYMKLQIAELSKYFDKNHSYYIGGEASMFSKKAIQMDLFRELNQVSQISLQGYQEFVENWDNLSYMRFTKKWLKELSEKYYPTNKVSLESAGKVPSTNKNLPASAVTKNDVFASVKDLSSKLESKNNTANNLMPDVFTKQPIEKFLMNATDVFGYLSNGYFTNFASTGRWNYMGTEVEGTSIFKIIASLDEKAKEDIRKANDALEKELDSALDKVANDANLMLDMPSGEVGYFGKFFKEVRMARPHPFVDVDPAPELSDNYGGEMGREKIAFVKDVVDLEEKNPKAPLEKRYVSYTGQHFDEIKVHVEHIKDENGQDLSEYKMKGFQNYSTFGGNVRDNGTKTDKAKVYYNPTATQEKYIEYVDDVKQPSPFASLQLIWEGATTGTVSTDTVAQSIPTQYKKAILHLVNKPFTAEDCTVFIGGAPKGGLFVRGEETSEDNLRSVWTDLRNEGEAAGADWRQVKVDAQVAYEIAPLEAEIKYLENNYPKDSGGDPAPCPSATQSHGFFITEKKIQERNKKLQSEVTWSKSYNLSVDPESMATKITTEQYNIAVDKANLSYSRATACPKSDVKSANEARESAINSAKILQISQLPLEINGWTGYMNSGERGDKNRFGEYIAFSKSLSQDTSQTVEANKFYNLDPDAYLDSKNKEKTEQKVRPECEYYPRLNPDGTEQIGATGQQDSGYEAGYLGDCCATNLEFGTDGQSVSADMSTSKTAFTALITGARAVNTNIIDSVANFLSFGTKDKISGDMVAWSLKSKVEDNAFSATLNSTDPFKRLVAMYRLIPTYEKSIKSYTKPMHFQVAIGVLNLVDDKNYNPNKDSTDPIDKLVATYRALGPTSDQVSRLKIVDSIIQIAITMSNYDQSEDKKQKHVCQPAKALTPLKDVAGAKSIESPSYTPLTAQRVIERENRAVPVPFNFIMGPVGDLGKMVPQLSLVGEKEVSTDDKTWFIDMAKKNFIDKTRISDLIADSFTKGVRVFFDDENWKVGPRKIGEDTLATQAPYRDQVQTQNRYKLDTPITEKIVPETSFKSCLLYGNYGIPVTEEQDRIRKLFDQAYIPNHSGPSEQLPPKLEIGERKWVYIPPPPGVPVTHYIATVKQQQNEEEKLGLDKKDKIVSIIKHKEPTNETIAKQLKNSTSFDLPVDSPRYVDMFHYDPIPNWDVLESKDEAGKTIYKSGIKDWKEYYEHVRFPYLDFFSVYGKDKKFSYIVEESRKSMQTTIETIQAKVDTLMRQMDQYLYDYVAQTSLQGPAGSGHGTLGNFTFDYNGGLQKSDLVSSVPEEKKLQVAKERLAFAIYWQHLNLAEKYKYTLHNYLSSDLSLSKGDVPKVVPDYFSDKVGYEAGTVIASSAFSDKIPLPFEKLNLQEKKNTGQAADATPIVPVVPEILGTCKNGDSYDPKGVPFLDWPSVIANCWIPSLTPLVKFDDKKETFQEFANGLISPLESAVGEGYSFLVDEKSPTRTGVVKTIKKTTKAFTDAVTTVQKSAENVAAGVVKLANTLDDVDGDGLFSTRAPVDPNILSPDTKSRTRRMEGGKIVNIYKDESNGLPDVQDYVEQIIVKYGTDEVKKVVFPLRSIQPFYLTAELQSKEGQFLSGDNLDYVQISLDEKAKEFVEIPEAEILQKASGGKITVHLQPKVSDGTFEGKIFFQVMRQNTPGSNDPYIPMDPPLRSEDITLIGSDAHIASSTYFAPNTTLGRSTIAASSVFATQEKNFLLGLEAYQNNTLLGTKNGKVTLKFQYKDPDLGTWEETGKIVLPLENGKYFGSLPLPTDPGKYELIFDAEEALQLPQTKQTMIVTESTVTKVTMELQPNILIEGESGVLVPTFLNKKGKKIVVSSQLAQLILPKDQMKYLSIPREKEIDGYPENDVLGADKKTLMRTLDFQVGSIDGIALEANAFIEGDPEVRTIPLQLQTTENNKVAQELTMYKKGSLSTQMDFQVGSKEISVLKQDVVRIHALVKNKAGEKVPYTGDVDLVISDPVVFKNPLKTIHITNGEAVFELIPSHKAGAVSLTLNTENNAFLTKEFDMSFTPGTLEKIHYTTTVDSPLQPKNGDMMGNKNTQKLLSVEGLDVYGNTIMGIKEVLFAVDPFEGLTLSSQRADGRVGEALPSLTVQGQKYYGATLTNGKLSIIAESTKVAGEMHVQVIAKNDGGEVLSDTITIPSRFTLDKDFITQWKPNILYTNLLGSSYGDVTQKDFLAGWWLFSGKGEAVTASTVSSVGDAVTAKVLPNGAIDIPQGDGLGSAKIAVPLLMKDAPFQVEIREQDSNKPLMRVRYRLAPFATIKEVISEEAVGSQMGIYYRKYNGTTVQRDEAKKQTVILSENEKVLTLLDNLQMIPEGNLPLITVDTENKALLSLHIATNTGKDLLDLYVRLPNAQIYQHQGGSEKDVEFALQKKQENDFSSQASAGNTAITYNDSLKATSAVLQKNGLISEPSTKDLYKNAVLASLDELGLWKGGTFSLPKDLSGIFSLKNGKVLLAGVDEIFDTHIIPSSLSEYNKKDYFHGELRSSFAIDTTQGNSLLQKTTLEDKERKNSSRDLFSLLFQARAENLTVDTLKANTSNGLLLDKTLADTIAKQGQYLTESSVDRITVLKTATKEALAMVGTDGSFVRLSDDVLVKRVLISEMIRYEVVEKTTGTIIGRMFLRPDGQHLRFLPYKEGNDLVYSTDHAGIYTNLLDEGLVLDKNARVIRRGNEVLLSFMPEHFLEPAPLYKEMLSVKDSGGETLGAKVPLVLSLRQADTKVLAEITIQHHEAPLQLQKSDVPLAPLGIMVETSLPVEKIDDVITVKDATGQVVFAFHEHDFSMITLPSLPWKMATARIDEQGWHFTLSRDGEIQATVHVGINERYHSMQKSNWSLTPGTKLLLQDPFITTKNNEKGSIASLILPEVKKTYTFAAWDQDIKQEVVYGKKTMWTFDASSDQGYLEGSAHMVSSDQSEQDQTILRMRGAYSTPDMPAAPFAQQRSMGIYTTLSSEKKLALKEPLLSLQRKEEGTMITFWKVKEQDGTVLEERKVASMDPYGKVQLFDQDFQWKYELKGSMLIARLYKKSTSESFDAYVIAMLPGVPMRVLPYIRGTEQIYQETYQGLYVQPLDTSVSLDEETLSIREASPEALQILSLSKSEPFVIKHSGYSLIPESDKVDTLNEPYVPSLLLKNNATGKNVAKIILQFHESPLTTTLAKTEGQVVLAENMKQVVYTALQPDISITEDAELIHVSLTKEGQQVVIATLSKNEPTVKNLSVKEGYKIRLNEMSTAGLLYTIQDTLTSLPLLGVSLKNDPRYMQEYYLGKSEFGERYLRPGIYIRMDASPLHIDTLQAQEFAQKIYFGFDELFSYSNEDVWGIAMPSLTSILPMVNEKNMRISLIGKEIVDWIIAVPKVKFTVKELTLGEVLTDVIAQNVTAPTLFFKNTSQVLPFERGLEMVVNTEGHPTVARYKGEDVVSWNEAMQPQVNEGVRIRYQFVESRGMGYVLYKNGQELGSFVYMPAFATIPKENVAQASQALASSAPVSNSQKQALQEGKTNEAITMLDAQGIFVQKMTTEKYYSLGYEATGSSTNEAYALVMNDSTLGNTTTDTPGGNSLSVDSSLTDGGRSVGWTGDLKNMTLFAAGNSVGFSTLPHMSETLINIGDPVISLQMKRGENKTNDHFTNDIGEFLYEHTGQGITSIKFFDIDNDGKKDILFAEGSGKIFGIKNMGGNPVLWKNLGQIFDVPEGIRKLLVTKLDGDDKLDLMIATKKTSYVAPLDTQTAPQNPTEGSIVSLLNLGNGIFQKGLDTINELGKVQDMSLGDFDGNGTDDLFALNDKQEVKVVLIAPTLPDGSKPAYKTILLDTLGMDLSKRDMAPEDIFARFADTTIIPASDGPTTYDPEAEVLFIRHNEIQKESANTALENDNPSKEGLGLLEKAAENVYSEVEGVQTQKLKLFARSNSPYIRSNGEKTEVIKHELEAVKKSNPFAFLGQGILGFNPVSLSQNSAVAAEALSDPRDLLIEKFAKMQKQGKIRKGNHVFYTITLTSGAKDPQSMEITDRLPTEMRLLPGSMKCELLQNDGSWKALDMKDVCTFAPSGDERYPYLFKNIDLAKNQKIRITYEAEVLQEPITYTLGVTTREGIGESAAASLGFKVKMMQAVINSDAFGGLGTMRYLYKYDAKAGEALFTKNFNKTSVPKPTDTNPMLASLASVMGYEIAEDGTMTPTEGHKTDDKKLTEFAKKLGKTMSTLMSNDKDEDGLIDFWDAHVVPKAQYVEQGSTNTTIGIGTSQVTDGINQALDTVNARLKEKNCNFGGCGLFPKNKAFLVPGKSELFEGGDVPIFAFPTPSGLVPVWPPDGSYFGSKSMSQIRIYFSFTLSGRMALSVCAAAFDYGNADTTGLLGILPIAPNANCYPVILPDFFHIQELCAALSDGVSSIINSATDLMSSDVYGAVKATKKALAAGGDTSKRAYHFEYSDPLFPPAVAKKLLSVAQSNLSTNTTYNKHGGAFPKIPMDWVTRQIEELLHLFKIPTVYIRLPDSRSMISKVENDVKNLSKPNTAQEAKAAAEKERVAKLTSEELRAEAKKLDIILKDTMSDEEIKTLISKKKSENILKAQQECKKKVAENAKKTASPTLSTSGTIGEQMLEIAGKLPDAMNVFDTVIDQQRGNIACDFTDDLLQQALEGSAYQNVDTFFKQGQSVGEILKQQKNIGEAMNFIASLPLVKFQTKEVTFDVPWMSPEQLYAARQNIQGALDQSLANFENFYRQVGPDCFFNKPSDFNTLQEPSFSLTPAASGTSNISVDGLGTSASGQVQVSESLKIKCLAAAKVGAGLWGSMQGLKINVQRINEYSHVQDKFKKYVQWKAYTLGRMVETVTSIIDFFSTYLTRQKQIIANWKTAMYQIKNIGKTFQIIPDVFQNYRNSCAGCVNEQGSATATILDALGNIIPDIPVVRIPLWPDVVIDVSNVNAQLQVTVPDIKLHPVEFDLPTFSALTFPDFSGNISTQDFSFMLQEGESVGAGGFTAPSIPELPALPELPDLPDFPTVSLPKLPDLPPPPIIPPLHASIKITLDILSKILDNLCLLKKNLVPVSESNLSSQIELLTRGTALFKIKNNRPSNITVPGLEQVKLTTSITLMGTDTSTLVKPVEYIASNWNKEVIGRLMDFIKGSGKNAQDGVADTLKNITNGTRNKEGKTPMDQLLDALKAQEKVVKTYNQSTASFSETLQKEGTKLTNYLSHDVDLRLSAVDQMGSSTSVLAEEDMRAHQEQVASLAKTLGKEDAQLQKANDTIAHSSDVQSLLAEMTKLQVLMSDLKNISGSNTDEFLPILSAQIALLEKEGDGLGDVKTFALEKLRAIRDTASAEEERVEDTVTTESPAVSEWKNMREHIKKQVLTNATVDQKIDRLSQATTLKEYADTLASFDMLASSEDTRLVAGSSIPESAQERLHAKEVVLKELAGSTFTFVPMNFETSSSDSKEEHQMSDEEKIGETPSLGTPNAWTSDISTKNTSALIAGAVNTTTTDLSNLGQPTSVATTTNGASTNPVKNLLAPEGSTSLLVQLDKNIPTSYVPVTNYQWPQEEQGMDIADINGDGKEDIIYYAGSELYLKYNLLTQAPDGTLSGAPRKPYSGTHALSVRTLESLMPQASVVQNIQIQDQSAYAATFTFSPERRITSLANPHTYALRMHVAPEAWLSDTMKRSTQDSYIEYYVYASPASTFNLDRTRISELAQQLQVEAQRKQEVLKREDLGTPIESVIVALQSEHMAVPLSFTKSGVAYSLTMAPYFPETKTYGTFSTPFFVHPQREQDKEAPVITLQEGAKLSAIADVPLKIHGDAADPSGVGSMYWDKDTSLDSDLDGDMTNDKDLVCNGGGATAPCVTTKDVQRGTVALAPELMMGPWTEAEVGKKIHVRLNVQDLIGNTSFKDVEIEVKDTQIFIDSYSPEEGIVEGHVDPVVPNAEIRVLRMRPEAGSDKKVIKELPLPATIKTDLQGRFRIEGVLSKKTLGVMGKGSSPVAEIDPTSGVLTMDPSLKNETLDLAERVGDKTQRSVYSTATLSITAQKEVEKTFDTSFIKINTPVEPKNMVTEIFSKDLLRSVDSDSQMTWEIQQAGVWKPLYRASKNPDGTVKFSFVEAMDSVTIGGKLFTSDQESHAVLLISFEGKPVGSILIPLEQKDVLFQIK